MLRFLIPSVDLYDEENNEFFETKEQVLQLEHSLVSLSKWESRWCKPFLSKEPKTFEESIDYVRCMTMNQHVDQKLYNLITPDMLNVINDYIAAPMTATTINNLGGPGPQSREIVTAEIIYYWMISFNIPFECQKWHLNRLLMLVNVCNIRNQPPKKMSKRETMSRNSALNAARRQALQSKG